MVCFKTQLFIKSKRRSKPFIGYDQQLPFCSHSHAVIYRIFNKLRANTFSSIIPISINFNKTYDHSVSITLIFLKHHNCDHLAVVNDFVAPISRIDQFLKQLTGELSCSCKPFIYISFPDLLNFELWII